MAGWKKPFNIMQEQIKFKLSDSFRNGPSVDSKSIGDELQRNLKAIESLLTAYYFKSRGRIFGVNLVVDSVEVLNDSLAKFLVRYSVGQFNACADVDYVEQESMEMLIDIDFQALEAIITGEYIPEREPDEL